VPGLPRWLFVCYDPHMAERNNPAGQPQHPLAVTRTELVWEGKYDSAGNRVAPLRVSLPFQTVETVNESAADRRHTMELFGQHRPSEWRNRLILVVVSRTTTTRIGRPVGLDAPSSKTRDATPLPPLTPAARSIDLIFFLWTRSVCHETDARLSEPLPIKANPRWSCS